MEMLRVLIGPDDAPSVAQFCIRAVIIFAFGIACIRIAGRRTFAQASPLDIIVAVMVGSNLSRAMTGKASFIGGLTATLVIVLLHRVLAMVSLRSERLARWIKCGPVTLISNGVIDRAQMTRHGIGESDLMEGLRMEQTGSVSEVLLATLEGGGKISVIKRQEDA